MVSEILAYKVSIKVCILWISRCIIAMGLDKKPTPPPKRVKEDVGRDVATHQDTTKDAPEVEEEQAGADPGSDLASSQPQDMETEIKEEITSEDQTKDGTVAEKKTDNQDGDAICMLSMTTCSGHYDETTFCFI